MRNLLASFGMLLFITSLAAQEVSGSSTYSNFTRDSTYYVLGDVVNVRLNPDIGGKVIYKLSIGEKVRILEDTGIPYTLNGYTANWYRVVYKHNQDKGEGYVWGGMIATQTVESKVEKGLYFMYGISSVKDLGGVNLVNITVKVCSEKKQLGEIVIEAVGGLGTFNRSESFDNRGLNYISDVFIINFSDGFCAGAFGDAYFFWDGKKLVHIKTLYEGFDAPYYSTNKLVFPTDEKGSKRGFIIQQEESGFYGNNGKVHVESWAKKTYQWDSEQLILLLEEGKSK